MYCRLNLFVLLPYYRFRFTAVLSCYSLRLLAMDNQRRGACNHIMAVWDPHSLCPGCRDCFIPDNPCLVCEGLTPEQRARSIQARALRLRRQARRAGSAGSVSGSSQCGPVEGKAFEPLGSTPEPSVKGQGGWVLPPRDLWCRGMVVEAALLPRRCRLLRRTMATPDAIPPWDLGLRMVVVAFGSPTLPFGERRRL